MNGDMASQPISIKLFLIKGSATDMCAAKISYKSLHLKISRRP